MPNPTPADVEAEDTGQFASPNIPAQANGVLQQQNPDRSFAQKAHDIGAAPSKVTALHTVVGTPATLTPLPPRKLGVSNSGLWMDLNRGNTKQRMTTQREAA